MRLLPHPAATGRAAAAASEAAAAEQAATAPAATAVMMAAVVAAVAVAPDLSTSSPGDEQVRARAPHLLRLRVQRMLRQALRMLLQARPMQRLLLLLLPAMPATAKWTWMWRTVMPTRMRMRMQVLQRTPALQRHLLTQATTSQPRRLAAT